MNSVIAHRVLERPQFAVLQRNVFPVYFGMQTVLPVIMALSYPGSKIAAAGWRGVFNEANRYDVLLPIATIFVSSLVNWILVMPATNAVSDKRYAQGTSPP